MEESPIQSLIDLRDKVKEMWTFKGRAALIRKIESSMEFIRIYRLEGSDIPGKMVKECQAHYEAGVKIMDEKYKEQPGESIN